ncbi:unnamed protein product [Sphagnum troendelagicum]
MSEMPTRVRAQNSTAVPRHEAQVPGTFRGGAASKLSRNQTSAPSTWKDPAKTRSGSPSSNPEQRSTSAGAPNNRMAIDPTPSPSRAEVETRADDKKSLAGATTPRNSIFFELPESDCSKAQTTGMTANPFASPVDGNQGGEERSAEFREEDGILEWDRTLERRHSDGPVPKNKRRYSNSGGSGDLPIHQGPRHPRQWKGSIRHASIARGMFTNHYQYLRPAEFQ